MSDGLRICEWRDSISVPWRRPSRKPASKSSPAPAPGVGRSRRLIAIKAAFFKAPDKHPGICVLLFHEPESVGERYVPRNLYVAKPLAVRSRACGRRQARSCGTAPTEKHSKRTGLSIPAPRFSRSCRICARRFPRDPLPKVPGEPSPRPRPRSPAPPPAERSAASRMRKSKRAWVSRCPLPALFSGKAPEGGGFTDSSSIISSVSFAPGEFISESVFSASAMSGSSRSPMSFFAWEDSASLDSVLTP